MLFIINFTEIYAVLSTMYQIKPKLTAFYDDLAVLIVKGVIM